MMIHKMATTRKPLRVLVTDDGYKSTLGIVCCLGKKGISVSVMADSPVALASYSRYCSGKFLVPPAGDEAFLPAVKDIVRRGHFDLLMPVGYTAHVALTRHKAELAPYTRMETADFEKIRRAADKRAMHELAKEVGVPTPRTLAPASYKEAVQDSTELRFPVVIKAPRETLCDVVRYARDRRELLTLYGRICESADGEGPLPLIQEFIPGFGCGFFALYQDGVCKQTFMHRRIREVPPSGGVSCCAESYYNERLLDYGKRLLDRLEWHGVAMVEFRYDERDRDYKLLEVNPKFWGSLDLALEAGVEFPYYLCQMARGQQLEYSEDYKRHLRYHWLLTDVQHVLMGPSSFGAFVADLLRPSVKSNISWSDFKPNLLEPLTRMTSVIRRLWRKNHRAYKGFPGFRTSKP